MLKRLGTLLGAAATGLAGAGIAVLATAVPAEAAGCSGAHGITVVVDANQLGGTQVGCAGGGSRSASSATTAAGFPVTYVQSSPGFVCRIAGKPASDPCVRTPPADAYWGLFWNDGKGGGWVYASLGAGSLTVPDGGYVGWSWQGGGGLTSPGVTPTPRNAPTATPQPTPSKAPTKSPTKSPTAAPSDTSSTSPSASAGAPSSVSSSASASASGKPSKKPGAGDSGSPSVSASESEVATEPASPASSSSAIVVADPADPAGSDGIPTWAVATIIAVLLGGAGTAGVVRRRGDHSP